MLDLCVAGIGLACFYGVVVIAQYWFGHAEPEIVISQSPRALPLYAFYSVVRIGLAYVLSLLFAVGYGYLAAYNKRLEALMIAGLDILQSIPVLSFLPGVMLAMVALFPTRQIGVEMGAIVLIFTGQVWNMAFSFYSSIKSIPRELSEAASIYQFSRWQRFVQLELPYSAIGLVWNSMVSVAGGWFFLMACEMFVLGTRDFRLPGLGSYLQTAAGTGNYAAIAWGLLTMIAIIVATDQLDLATGDCVERQIQVRTGGEHAAGTVAVAASAPTLARAPQSSAKAHCRADGRRDVPADCGIRREQRLRPRKTARHAAVKRARWPYAVRGSASLVVQLWRFCTLPGMRWLCCARCSGSQFAEIMKGALATFLRVNVSLVLAAAWTIPVGVAIGFHPRLARIAQPIAQIAASVPATALFPVILIALVKMGGGLGIGSIALMLLGTQWYILFNVIAGAMAIPSDLREVATLFRFHDRAAMEDGHSAGNLSLPDYGHGDGVRRCVERQHYCGVLSTEQPDLSDGRPGRGDQRRNRQRAVPDSAAGYDRDGDDGGHDQSTGVAATLSSGGDSVQAGRLSRATDG